MGGWVGGPGGGENRLFLGWKTSVGWLVGSAIPPAGSEPAEHATLCATGRPRGQEKGGPRPSRRQQQGTSWAGQHPRAGKRGRASNSRAAAGAAARGRAGGRPAGRRAVSPAVEQDTLAAINVGDGGLAGGCGAKAWVKGADAGAAGGVRRGAGTEEEGVYRSGGRAGESFAAAAAAAPPRPCRGPTPSSATPHGVSRGLQPPDVDEFVAGGAQEHGQGDFLAVRHFQECGARLPGGVGDGSHAVVMHDARHWASGRG